MKKLDVKLFNFYDHPKEVFESEFCEPRENPSQLALKLGALLKLGGRAEREPHPAVSSENRKHVSGEALEINEADFLCYIKKQ